MALIDEAQAERALREMGPTIEVSGGSAANTIVGAASFGARAAFVGKVKNDSLGQHLHPRHPRGGRRLRYAAGDRRLLHRALLCARDAGRRAHAQHLSGRGAGPAPERHRRRRRSRRPRSPISKAICGTRKDAKDAFLKAAKIAHDAGADGRAHAVGCRSASIAGATSSSDLIRGGTIDLLFANEAELHSLYQTADFDTAVAALRADARLAVVTRSEKGCIVVSRESTQAVHAVPVERVVDTTGAGDLFAAGFLFGLARGACDRGCGAARRPRRGGGDPASGGAAGDLAQGACAGQRALGLTPRPVRKQARPGEGNHLVSNLGYRSVNGRGARRSLR